MTVLRIKTVLRFHVGKMKECKRLQVSILVIKQNCKLRGAENGDKLSGDHLFPHAKKSDFNIENQHPEKKSKRKHNTWVKQNKENYAPRNLFIYASRNI